jgi:hypothetical protein
MKKIVMALILATCTLHVFSQSSSPQSCQSFQVMVDLEKFIVQDGDTSYTVRVDFEILQGNKAKKVTYLLCDSLTGTEFSKASYEFKDLPADADLLQTGKCKKKDNQLTLGLGYFENFRRKNKATLTVCAYDNNDRLLGKSSCYF